MIEHTAWALAWLGFVLALFVWAARQERSEEPDPDLARMIDAAEEVAQPGVADRFRTVARMQDYRENHRHAEGFDR